MKTHALKTHPEPFAAVCLGHKTCEVRKDDRGFKVGDVLLLEEYEPKHTVIVPPEEARKLILGRDYLSHESDGMTNMVRVHYDGRITGNKCMRRISHIQTGYGIEPGHAMLSLVSVWTEDLRS